jgi:hypothetical protein
MSSSEPARRVSIQAQEAPQAAEHLVALKFTL